MTDRVQAGMTIPQALLILSAQLDGLQNSADRIQRGQRVILRAITATAVAMRADLHEEITAMTDELGTELTGIEGDLTAAEQAEAAELADLQRELTDLVNTQNEGMLTGDQHQRLDAVRARIEALTAQSQAETTDIDTADPPPAAPAAEPAADVPAEGDGTATGAAPVV